MEKLYGLFAEYTSSFGQQLFVHKYKYCTAREIIKEKRILEETLLEMTLNNDENNSVHDIAKKMIIDGESFDTIIEKTDLRLKDLKTIQRDEIDPKF